MGDKFQIKVSWEFNGIPDPELLGQEGSFISSIFYGNVPSTQTQKIVSQLQPKLLALQQDIYIYSNVYKWTL